MPKNEDGEFELILGNRQLLSVFFIVVILLGVFFTMGYIVGRNSTPIVADSGSRSDGKPSITDSPAPSTDAPSPAAGASEPVADTNSGKPISTATQQPDDPS